MTILPAIVLPDDPDPNVPQRLAASPDMDVWVEASAGSGKTKVLTDRVLRLMLPNQDGKRLGAKPHRILCITFTKAGAALMALRVQERLSSWAVMTDADLRKDLHDNLLGYEPSDIVIQAARRLFTDVLDVPGGLSIMTIHAFCQSVLARFPLEAGIASGFTVLDDTQAAYALRDLIRRLVSGVYDEAVSSRNDIRDAFERLSVYKDNDSLQTLLRNLMNNIWEVQEFLGDMRASDSIRTKLLEAMGVDKNLDVEVIWNLTCGRLPDNLLIDLSQCLGKGTKREVDAANSLATFLAMPRSERFQQFVFLKDIVFTKQDTPRDFPSFKDGKQGSVNDILQELIVAIREYEDMQGRLEQAAQTADLLTVASYCLDMYQDYKRRLGALDFTDMIVRVRRLLETRSLDWVHFKLDEGIDHILVDEAQDTNSNQWAIIRLLSDEFHAGLGRSNDSQRSFFVVGDKKQSIFSFHGADPAALKDMHLYFSRRAREGGRIFQDEKVRLQTSFRTIPPILQLVDQVFEDKSLAGHLGLYPDQKLVHFSQRRGEGGSVEVWPIMGEENHQKLPSKIEKGEKSPSLAWQLPPVSYDMLMNSGGAGATLTDNPLARQIALKIAAMIDGNDVLVSENRHIRPRDILILVRTRTSFVTDIIRQLKLQGIPVSGADRLNLGDHIAVADCLALARFARLPDDDLSLACVLKSPFIRVHEDILMDLALSRGEMTLWSHMQTSSAQSLLPQGALGWLTEIIEAGAHKKPFEFFDDILNKPCPRDREGSVWRAMAQDLGGDCRDPLSEFLGIALKFEQDGIYGLEEFIDRFQRDVIEIKRPNTGGGEDGPDEVRIMTVHASKGLEAPIVFLPDTTGFPDRRKLDSLQWLKNETSGYLFPLWSAGAKTSTCTLYKEAKENQFLANIAEYHRLLYVALTRARDRLYIAGEKKDKSELNPQSWYALAESAARSMGYICDKNTGRLGFYAPQKKENSPKNKKKTEISGKGQFPVLPEWFREKPQSLDITAMRILNPSRQLSGEGLKVIAPSAETVTDRFLRGNVTHRLFEILPSLPVLASDRRRQVAALYLERSARKLSPETRENIVDEVMRIIEDPVFSEVFGPHSLAEVPLCGPIGDGQVINGQIDRLVILPDRILIVDFKTNRPSPDNIADIPQAYRQQLAAYKAAVSRIYPKRKVLCALLWTDKPLFMPVDIE